MSAQKSSSVLMDREEEIKANPSVQNDGIQSENLHYQSSRIRNRVPVFMKEALLQNRLSLESSKNGKDEQTIKKQTISSVFFNSLKKMKNIIKCQICECEMNKNGKKLSMCKCQHNSIFCESCLHHYVIYKVKMFEEVPCPKEGCNILLDTEGIFFHQLPVDIQKSYKKLHQFYQTVNDPHKKLCPKENCEGIILMTSDQLMKCNICQTQLCYKCLLDKHKGDCDQIEVDFFQNTLHYRQCQCCKFVVERLQGCNHMTCRCGHQFCYVCGVNWEHNHNGNHDQNGNIIGENIVPQERCCICCQQICGQTCACILKLPLKLFLLLTFFLCVVLIFISRDIVIVITMFLSSIIAGMFRYSCSYLSKLEGNFFLLGVVFFPVCMIIGIGIGFKELFIGTISQVCEQEWAMYREAVTDICQL